MNEQILLYIALAAVAICVVLLIILVSRQSAMTREMNQIRKETQESIQFSLKTFGDTISTNQRDSAAAMDNRLADLNHRFSNMAVENEQKLENIRNTMERKITDLTSDNNKQLEQMRQTVDEKLQKTLEDRIGQSFKLVSERLEQVYKGLGEMQTLAVGVGDLKKVLSNVKTRGILGEVQLGAILEQILAPGQYEENVAVKGGSERVEFAVKFPGEGDAPVYLPIDSKFPADAYMNLQTAYDTGDRQLIKAATDNLRNAVLKAARDIRTKYIAPPRTTEFAIMFLPFEGLYAEVLRLGLVDTLQRDYRINIAGPTTMSAMLNSFQMGFRSIALQKQSGQVWDTLAKVRNEFDKFGDVLIKTQSRMEQTQRDLEALVGVRTRGIQRALKDVSSSGEAGELSGVSDEQRGIK